MTLAVARWETLVVAVVTISPRLSLGLVGLLILQRFVSYGLGLLLVVDPAPVQ